MRVDDLFRTNEISIQCDNPEVEEETKEEEKKQD